MPIRKFEAPGEERIRKFETPEERMERIEREEEEERERLKRGEKLKGVIEKIAGELKKEIPVHKSCRIKMRPFSDKYGKEIEKDLRKVREKEEEWFPGVPEEEWEKERINRAGERLERLKTFIFYKFLSPSFIVARTSYYDDYLRGIDNIILERKTGRVVCALDEVSATSGERYKQKRGHILARNKRRRYDEKGRDGATVKYGIGIQEEKVVLEQLEGVPIFYLALPEDWVEKGIEELEPSLDKFSTIEKRLFRDYFLTSMEKQAGELLDYPFQLSERMKKNLEEFTIVAEELKKEWE